MTAVTMVGLAAAARVQVEMVADVVCPYCYIGLHRLQQAVKGASAEVDVKYTPFILRRHLPKDGVLKKDVFRAQFGSDEQGARVLAQVEATAASDGLCFDLGDQKAGNSEDAHRLLLWADREAGPARAMELFGSMVRAYNCERGWLGEHDVLLRAVSRVEGLDAEAARRVLGDATAYARELEAGLERAAELGVRGVPTFLVNGKPLASGAVSAEALRSAINESCAASG